MPRPFGVSEPHRMTLAAIIESYLVLGAPPSVKDLARRFSISPSATQTRIDVLRRAELLRSTEPLRLSAAGVRWLSGELRSIRTHCAALTLRQLEVLRAIVRHRISNEGRVPTVPELAQILHVTGQAVYDHLCRLRDDAKALDWTAGDLASIVLEKGLEDELRLMLREELVA